MHGASGDVGANDIAASTCCNSCDGHEAPLMTQYNATEWGTHLQRINGICNQITVKIWRFPEIKVPTSHLLFYRLGYARLFKYQRSIFMGTSILGNHHMLKLSMKHCGSCIHPIKLLRNLKWDLLFGMCLCWSSKSQEELVAHKISANIIEYVYLCISIHHIEPLDPPKKTTPFPFPAVGCTISISRISRLFQLLSRALPAPWFAIVGHEIRGDLVAHEQLDEVLGELNLLAVDMGAVQNPHGSANSLVIF